MTRSEWIRAHVVRPGALAEMARLEQVAQAEHPRTGIRIADYATLSDLERRATDEGKRIPEHRTWPPVRAHRNRPSWGPGGDWLLHYVDKYVNACNEYVRFYGRGYVTAEAVHVRATTGKWPEGAVKPDDRPAPTGSSASTIAAPWNGASWLPGRASQRRAAGRFFIH